MINFKYPLAMSCTEEQYWYLREELIKLGYNLPNRIQDSYWHCLQPSCIMTNWNNNSKEFGITGNSAKSDRYYIKEYNPELFLALAASVDSEYFYPGEYVKYSGECKEIKNAGLLKVEKESILLHIYAILVALRSSKGNFCVNARDLTKLTKEEIINHFKMKESRKIIGYKLIKTQYEKAAKQIAFHYFTSFYPYIPIDNYVIKDWREAGVLNIWFEPVYEEELINIGGFNVMFFDNKVQIGFNTLTKEDLIVLKKAKNLMLNLDIGFNGNYFKGCDNLDEKFSKICKKLNIDP